MDQRIGVLCREGRDVYYAFVNGYSNPPVEGSLYEVEASLGLRIPPARLVPVPTFTDAEKKLAVRTREYTARVYLPEGGFRHYNEYTVEARNKTEARTLVRREFRGDVPAPRYGFISFEECRLVWVEEE